MDAIQGGLTYVQRSVNMIQLGHAYRMLRDLSHFRCQLVMRILASGALNVIELERAMYKAGDSTISQCETSQIIAVLMRHRIIMRVYPDGMSLKKHYYDLNRKQVRKIASALARFNNPDQG